MLIHDFALYANRSGPHNVAFFHFGELSCIASTTAYTVDELGAAMQKAGFVDVVIRLNDLLLLLEKHANPD